MCTVDPLNREPILDKINSAVLLMVERASTLGGSKCTVGTIEGLNVVSHCREVFTLWPSSWESPLSEVSM